MTQAIQSSLHNKPTEGLANTLSNCNHDQNHREDNGKSLKIAIIVLLQERLLEWLRNMFLNMSDTSINTLYHETD